MKLDFFRVNFEQMKNAKQIFKCLSSEFFESLKIEVEKNVKTYCIIKCRREDIRDRVTL